MEPQTIQNVSREQADAMLKSAVAKAEEIGVRMNIAIFDAGANLKAFVRMDGALLGSMDVSMKKAHTAALFQKPSADFGPTTQPGAALYSIQLTNGGVVSIGGGLPIRATDGSVIGSIGVSGSSVENDLIVAEAGLSALS